jgi:hypothetical protein
MMSIATVLDLRYKMKLINFYFPIIYPLPPTVDRPNASYHIENVLTVLKELFKAYVSAYMVSILQETAQVNDTVASSSSAIVKDVVPKMGQGRSRYADHVRSSDII